MAALQRRRLAVPARAEAGGDAAALLAAIRNGHHPNIRVVAVPTAP
jgi:hypothetical protein